MSMTPAEMLAELRNFQPTQLREWTLRDRLVYRLTGRVSERIYEDRMRCMAIDRARSEDFARRLRA